ncbi:MAG: hypothetical protein J3R72DRAFT_398006 [Linnemannia gamsii]|nr:MAG: hypothetical protein J3R72DRAFT_398006 [Linnemannia gamsii]
MDASNHPKDDIHAAEAKLSSVDATTTATTGPEAPLSVFFLPQDLIASLVPQAPTDTLGLLTPLPVEQPTSTTRDSSSSPYSSNTPAVATSLDSAVPSCRICGIANLESVEKQREHVRLDWHRYNLKQQLLDKSARPITEQQFENMIQDLSSISGSDTDDTGSDQEALIQSLMKKLELTVKQNQNARNQDPVLVLQQQALEQQLQEARSSPFVWFTSTLYDETVRLGIYKNALPNRGLSEDVPPKQARYWTLIMIGGGHFAGIVMDLAGQVSTHGRDMKVVAHKTFHRYTVRKKQGGSQAAHGVANSAGARIRMYNEEALKTEVRELLEGWSHWIKQSECVFVHAPGNNRKVLYYENSVLSAAEKQGRLRSIPFMTRRPTLTELKRAYQELTTVKVSVLTKEALERQAQAEQDALEKAHEAKSVAAAKDGSVGGAKGAAAMTAVVPEAPAELLKLIELVKKGRAEAMSSHLLKHGIDPSQLLSLSTSTEYDIRRTPTILHLAAHHGQAQVVKLLLEKHHADPTTTTLSAQAVAEKGDEEEGGEDEGAVASGSSFTAYDIAKDKETRNAFRRAMALLPDSWDWIGLAHVPSALTPEMEADQERKAKEKTRKLLDAERERKKTREVSRPSTPTNNRSGATTPTSTTTSSSSLLGKNLASATAANSQLSPEMRMRLERERRANAAEARFAAMKQQETVRRAVQEGKNVCVACGKALDGLMPFDKFGRKFCTTDCVAKGPA